MTTGDYVMPLDTPERLQCASCTSGKTEFCQAIRQMQGLGLMSDASSRFSSGGEMNRYYMGPSIGSVAKC